MNAKQLILSLTMITGICFSSCKQSGYITEYYIKNKVEKHVPGEQSTIKTYSIYQGTSKPNKNASSYIELTGIKYHDMKKLITGTDIQPVGKVNLSSGTFVVSAPTYVMLDLSDCNSIVSNYHQLQDANMKEQPIPSEEIYHDYTASTDLYISFRKAIGHSGNNEIDIWVAEKKFTVKTKKFINKLKRFIDY